MQIKINTDSNIEGREALHAQFEAIVEAAMSHSRAQISRVEVHLSDENGSKSGQDDKRCMMEARIEGRQPTAVTHHAATLALAVSGAADKLKKALGSILGRVRAP